MNFCTSENGRYSNCVYNDSPVSSPSVTVNNNRPTTMTTVNNYKPASPTSSTNGYGGSSPTTVNVQSDYNHNGNDTSSDMGLAGWAIFLIILFVLILICCIGYAIFFSCCRDGGRYYRGEGRSSKKEVVHNNIYFDEKSCGNNDDDASSYFEDRSRATGYSSRRSRRAPAVHHHHEEAAETAIVLAQPLQQGRDPTFYNTQGQQGKDPTFYIPGEEDKPDPETGYARSVESSSSHKYYMEADGNCPSIKNKREPTMYVDGHSYGGNSSQSYMEDPPLKPKRDPTMYVDGHGRREPSVYFEDGRDPTMYIDGMESSPSHMILDHLGSSRSDVDPPIINRKSLAYNQNDRGGGVESGAKDQYHCEMESNIDESFRTQEPSVSGNKSVRSKKKKSSSRKSSKSKKGGGSSHY